MIKSIIWLLRTAFVTLTIVTYKVLGMSAIFQEWYWLCLQWVLIWGSISVYIKLGGD